MSEYDDSDSYEIGEDKIEEIKAKAPEDRTGHEVAVLGIDTALEAARAAMENAGFELEHLILVYEATSTPDKNPQTEAKAGMVAVPHHPSCNIRMLLNSAMSLATGSGIAVAIDPRDLFGQDKPQDGPIGDA